VGFSRLSFSSLTKGNLRFLNASLSPFKSTISVEALIVAGGGGGCGTSVGGGAGGGGAGGLLYYGSEKPKTPNGPALELTRGITYTCTVGNGGNGVGSHGDKGQDSSISGSGFTTLTAIGGGGGMTRSLDRSKSTGGSGGGGPEFPDASVYGFGTPLQGNPGGFGETNVGGGGGGGAGSPGSSASALGGRGGAGGNGLGYLITGTLTYYAGGGGGSRNSGVGGPGGIGGGGSGGRGSAGTAWDTNINGQANTGGGGGGSYETASGNGGSGIIVLRSLFKAASTSGTVTEIIDGDFYVYKFTGTGTIVY
jgi:hypothetical protein